MDCWTGPAADYERTQSALLEAGITDGLPAIPPTRDRVDRMLAAARLDAGTVLGVLPPTYVDLTWNDVAINAVMAGCTPACLPIVGAAEWDPAGAAVGAGPQPWLAMAGLGPAALRGN